MTVSRMLLAAFVALAAGIAVENAKAKSDCADSPGCSMPAAGIRTTAPG